MADTYKTLQTRIKQKYDTLSNWVTNNPVLLKGELAVVEVPTGDTSGASTQPPAIMFKIGDGSNKFTDLPWASAKAADVYAWAKESSVSITETGTGTFISKVEWDSSANGGKGAIKITKNTPPTGDNQTIAGVDYSTGSTVQFDPGVVVSLKGEYTASQSSSMKPGVSVTPNQSGNTITLGLNNEALAELSDAYSHSKKTSGNPHNVTKSDVGLGSVVNTGDSSAPAKDGTEKFTTGGAYNMLQELTNKIEGKKTGYVMYATRDYGRTDIVNFKLVVPITREVDYITIDYKSDLYFMLIDGSTTLATNKLQVGDSIYTAEAEIKDWFVGDIYKDDYIVLFPISADSVDLANYVNTLSTPSSTKAAAFISSISKSGNTLTATKTNFGSFTIAGTTYSPGTGDKTLAVTASNPTLSWGASSKVATIGNTTLNVTMPSNPNTHYTSGMYVGASNAKSNAAVTSPYLKLYDDSTQRSQFQIKGAGATTVTSDASGNITITSTNTDTNTWRPVQVNGTTKLTNSDGVSLNFKNDTYTTFSYDSGVKVGLSDKVVTTDNYLVIDCGSSSTNIF